MPLKISSLGVAGVIGLLLATAVALPASANTIDSFAISPQTTPAGVTVTATGTWTASSTDVRSVQFAMPQSLVDAGATWQTVSATATQECVAGTPPTEAACLWRPAAAGEVLTMTATLDLPDTVLPGSYPLTASAAPADENGSLTQTLTVLSAGVPEVRVDPATVAPGTSATATATFTSTTGGDLRVGVYLEGSSGVATFGSATPAGGLTGCVADGPRALSCSWPGSTPGAQATLAIPVVIDAAAANGATATVRACVNQNTATSTCATTRVAVVVPPVVTPTPTPTTPPVTPPVTTPPSGTSNPVTAAAGPRLAESGGEPMTAGALAAGSALLVALGTALAAIDRRRRRDRAAMSTAA